MVYLTQVGGQLGVVQAGIHLCFLNIDKSTGYHWTAPGIRNLHKSRCVSVKTAGLISQTVGTYFGRRLLQLPEGTPPWLTLGNVWHGVQSRADKLVCIQEGDPGYARLSLQLVDIEYWGFSYELLFIATYQTGDALDGPNGGFPQVYQHQYRLSWYYANIRDLNALFRPESGDDPTY